jgi:hypothetical protein
VYVELESKEAPAPKMTISMEGVYRMGIGSTPRGGVHDVRGVELGD